MTMLTAIDGITAPLIPAAPTASATAGAATDTAPHAPEPRPHVEPFARDAALDAAARALTPSRRGDGWTPGRQRAFLDHVATGVTVADAAALVGLSVASAYAFRKRAAGAAFAVGWSAALLLQRHRLADDLMARALTGVTDTVTNARGEVCQRHRHDNRLALAMLTRLDKLAAADVPDRTGDARAARLAAGDWDRYLDLIGGDASPAQAGLFLSLRSTEGEAEAITPIVALARADLYQRTRAGHASEVAIHDLDPAHRDRWSAEDWARAEAGGLVTLAAPEPEPEPARTPQLPQHSAPKAGVWWCDKAEDWRTAFPPPDHFDGVEDGDFGDDDYSRELSAAELDAVEADRTRHAEALRVADAPARDRFFAALLSGEEEDDEAGTEAAADPPWPLDAGWSERADAGARSGAGQGGSERPAAAAGGLPDGELGAASAGTVAVRQRRGKAAPSVVAVATPAGRASGLGVAHATPIAGTS